MEVNMKNNKFTVFFVLTAFIISITACAGAPVKEKAGAVPQQTKSAKQLKFEQEEDNRSLLVKGASTFAGLLIGGLVGLFTSQPKNVVTSTLIGCVAGGVVGFGAGMIIFDKTKQGEQSADENKVKDYFQDYRNMQLKE
jgi:outer membrane lipoprotein SlyB